jgi:F-type H+-transporting ATPase subunit b
MTFNWWTFLFEVLNFVVLAYVLYRLLYRPLREAIDQRRQATLQAQAEADKARKDAAAVQERLQTQLAELEQHRQEAIRKAREEADSERRKLLAETERRLQVRQEEHRQALEQERSEALKALRAEVIAQAVELTRRLLSEAADQDLHRQLALRLVQNLQDLPEQERDNLRTRMQSDDVALLETAQELDSATLEEVGKAMTALTGKQTPVTVQTKPGLIGGVRLRLGGQVWDSSLSSQLPDASPGATQDGSP